MDKPSKIDLYVNKLEERQREHYERKVMLIKKIKAWLEDEVNSYKQIQDSIDNGEKAEDVCDQPEVLFGRNECAEGLLNQIKTWENENVNK